MTYAARVQQFRLATALGYLTLAVLAACAAQVPAVDQHPKSYALHQAAPRFALQDIFARPLSLSGYRGKVVLLNFWATWCPPCQAETPALVDLQRRLGPKGLAIIGISFDEATDPITKFYREHGMNYKVARMNSAFNTSYGALLQLPESLLVRPDKMINATLPTFLLIDRKGRLQFVHVGSMEVSAVEKEIEGFL
jgi:cytochrome c biogenesis protein CcmG, thiol:disulfide interchange protein DsbE